MSAAGAIAVRGATDVLPGARIRPFDVAMPTMRRMHPERRTGQELRIGEELGRHEMPMEKGLQGTAGRRPIHGCMDPGPMLEDAQGGFIRVLPNR